MILQGDCVEKMREMEEASIDAIVCDPPYSLSFMGKDWDKDLNHGPWATEALRVLKPGGHLLAFGGTRTYHRLTCAIEDAGFEIRDSLIWLYGSGFPKSLDVSKAIDKAAGVEREPTGRDGRTAASSWLGTQDGETSTWGRGEWDRTDSPATPEAAQWEGFGTSLKPGHEPVVVARKPLIGTVAYNVQNTGGYWVDVPNSESGSGSSRQKVCNHCRDELSGLRQGDPGTTAPNEAGEASSDLQSQVPRRDNERGEPLAMEGGAVDRRSGLRGGERGRGRDSQEATVRTSSGDREDHQAQAKAGGDGASPGREQAEQPPVESGADDGGRESGAFETSRATGCERCGRPLYGTGALNIDGCRIGTTKNIPASSSDQMGANGIYGKGMAKLEERSGMDPNVGRWPANVVLSHLGGSNERPNTPPTLDEGSTRSGTSDAPSVHPAPPGVSEGRGQRAIEALERIAEYQAPVSTWNETATELQEIADATLDEFEVESRHAIDCDLDEDCCAPGCPIAELDEQSGERPTGDLKPYSRANRDSYSGAMPAESTFDRQGDSGGASRFFYTAKSSRGERNAGLDGFEEQHGDFGGNGKPGAGFNEVVHGKAPQHRNVHPTVKPIDLMRWLVRLVTPPGGTVLDPFTGSGTTGCATALEGFDFIGIEREAEYVAIARARIAFWEQHAGRDTEDVLVEAGFSERLEREHREAGQLGLLDSSE